MAKKIIPAILGGIIVFGFILGLVGYFMGGSVGHFNIENGQFAYDDGNNRVALYNVPRWISGYDRYQYSDAWENTGIVEETPFSLSEVSNVGIDVGAGYIVIEKGDAFALRVEGPMKYSSTLEHGMWRVTAKPPQDTRVRNNRFYSGNQDITTTFYFTVPQNFNHLDVAIDLGEATIDDLTLERLECSAGLGSIHINNITALTASLDVSLGSISADSLTADSLEANCDMGSIYVEGRVNTLVEADCSMGKIRAQLDRPSDYHWSASTDMGSAIIGGHTISGFDSQMNGGNPQSDVYYNLSTGMGSIEINFN